MSTINYTAVCFFLFLAPFYIAADNEKRTIIVSIRGTLSATDILTDINVVEDVLETELFGYGHCHSGKIYNRVSNEIFLLFLRYALCSKLYS